MKMRLMMAAAAVVCVSQPAVSAPKAKQLGKVNFETSCKPAAQKLFNRAMLYQHSFWYRASQRTFEEALKADPELRHGLLGHRAEPALEPARAAAGEESGRGLARSQKGKSVGAKTAARARLHRRARRHVRRPRQGRPPHPRADLSQGHGAAGAALSEGRRGADLLRARAQRRGVTGRQDLRQPAQGRGAAGADLQAPAAASGRRALPDPPLRLSADRREGPRCGASATPRSRRPRRTPSTCRRTSSPASATGRSSIASNAESARVAKLDGETARSAARHGLSGLCASAAGAGQEGQGRDRRDDRGRAQDRPLRPAPMRARRAPARYAVERGDWKAAAELAGPAEPVPYVQTRSRISPARSARRAPATRQPPRRTSPSSPSCATSCATPRTPTGRSRSTSSARSPPPGCSTPRASTTRRSRR